MLNLEKFALNDVVSSVDAIIQPMAKAKGQEFHLEVSGIRHEYLVGDETRINQILINQHTGDAMLLPEFTVGLLLKHPQLQVHPEEGAPVHLAEDLDGAAHQLHNATRINQILINLLSNAVKYTPEGGSIWLRIIGLKLRSISHRAQNCRSAASSSTCSSRSTRNREPRRPESTRF